MLNEHPAESRSAQSSPRSSTARILRALPRSRAAGAPRQRRPASWRALLLVPLAIAIVTTLLPLAVAAGNAWATKRGVEQALDALSDGDLEAARSHALDAREDAADMERSTAGPTGAVWDLLPGADTDQHDVRLLSSALVDMTDVVTTAVDAYPPSRAGDGFLIGHDRTIDIVALKSVLGEVDGIRAEVASAVNSLDGIEGSTTLLGPVLRRAAESAQDRLDPVRDGLELVRPLEPVLPRLLGANGRQDFLVALLNPAEQRFSGGASLSFMTLTLEEGRLSEGDAIIGANEEQPFGRMTWKPVHDNPFHRRGQLLRLSTASLAPSWSVSGEELLRAWEKREHTTMDGLVAVDVMALQHLMRFTGPFEVPGYGTVTAGNLAAKLIGSYDELTSPEAFAARRAGSVALLSRFQDRMLSTSGLFGKLGSLVSSAEARHLAVYHRDPGLASAFAAMGLSGDLSDTTHDYVGVFNQALTGGKSDYWQRRKISQEVTLLEDGGARERLIIEIHNDSPPPADGVDPRYSAYVRRDNDMSLAAFLPWGVRNLSVQIDGIPVATVRKRWFRGRPFVTNKLRFAPQETRTVTLSYKVPRAATVRPNALVYRLDVDPQGLVDPESFSVSVRWPDHFRPKKLPPGWTTDGRSAVFHTEDLSFSPRWQIGLTSRRADGKP